MEVSAIQVHTRTNFGKKAAKEIRTRGRIPVVAYGRNNETRHFEVDVLELTKALRARGRNTLLELKMEDGTATALLKDLQRHPVRRHPLHADFLVVSMDQEISTKVDIDFQGRPIGNQLGGKITIVSRTLKIRCKPNNIPKSIGVDVSELDLGETIRISDVQFPEGIISNEDDRLPLMSISGHARKVEQ